MSTYDRYFIFATLPDCGDEIVLLSSTWLTGEYSHQGLPITQLPSGWPKKFYRAVESHTPCQPGDEKCTFREFGRSILFSHARKMESQLSEESMLGPEGTLNTGLPQKRKRRRNVSSEKEPLKVPRSNINRPTHVEYDLPQLGSCSLSIAAPPLTATSGVQSALPTYSSRIPTTPVRPVHRLQSPQSLQICAIKCSGPSTSQESNLISLHDIYEVLMDMQRQQNRTAALVAHVHERCKAIQQLLEGVLIGLMDTHWTG
ncbi:unnamed protein product [Calicophoron daubneyi]|uniref:Uncharacterized protein n=1 Tax=Calicophoron daubneyi TaxID=300641 RepID=A0AAV2TZ86_CALDB